MNFFEGSSLDDSAHRKTNYSPKKSRILDDNNSITSKKSNKQNNLDQLNNLLNQDQLKKINPSYPSSVRVDLNNQLKITGEWAAGGFTNHNYNTSTQLNYNNDRHKDISGYNRSSINRIQIDNRSQDDNSFASILPPSKEINYDYNLTMKTNENNVAINRNKLQGARSMMKPPIRKKKQTSTIKDVDSVSILGGSRAINQPIQYLGSYQYISNRNEKLNQKEQCLTINPIITDNKNKFNQLTEQKIISLNNINNDIRKQLQDEIKITKQSYQRQIKLLEEQVKRLVKKNNQDKIQLMKETQKQLEIEKNKWEKIIKEENQRLVAGYEWEKKRRTDTYDMQINHLKNLIETTNKQFQGSKFIDGQQQKYDIKYKQQELQKQKNKLQIQKQQLKNKYKILQSQQNNFEIYRRNQQNKLLENKKQIQRLENQIKKQQNIWKYTLKQEKQKNVEEITNLHIQYARQKQQLQRARQELNMEKELFIREKMQYEQLNIRVTADYKQKVKELELGRQKIAIQKMQLRDKIHTVDLMNNQLEVKKNFPQTQTKNGNFFSRERASSALEMKIVNTQERYKVIEESITNRQRLDHKSHTKLEPFLQSLVRKHRKFHV